MTTFARGDVVIMAHQGEHGKPRPAVVIQADGFPQEDAISVLPITSGLAGDVTTRVTLYPEPPNGLRAQSEVALNRITAIAPRKIGRRIGALNSDTMGEISRKLSAFLGIAT